MFKENSYRTLPPEVFWNHMLQDLGLLLSPEDATITTLSNSAAFLYGALEQINWVGYYLFDGQKLVLGPFCGKPACTTIAMGNGVCGAAAERMEVVVVEDVLKFPGHIACDAASRSEIVLPIIINGVLLGVLDMDSPIEARFQPGEVSGLKKVVEIITSKIVRPNVLM